MASALSGLSCSWYSALWQSEGSSVVLVGLRAADEARLSDRFHHSTSDFITNFHLITNGFVCWTHIWMCLFFLFQCLWWTFILLDSSRVHTINLINSFPLWSSSLFPSWLCSSIKPVFLNVTLHSFSVPLGPVQMEVGVFSSLCSLCQDSIVPLQLGVLQLVCLVTVGDRRAWLLTNRTTCVHTDELLCSSESVWQNNQSPFLILLLSAATRADLFLHLVVNLH